MPRRTNPTSVTAISAHAIEARILLVRGLKVLLDSDLATLYGVETKALSRAVSRNVDRFPADFAFVLEAGEVENLRYQIGTSSSHGGRRHPPRVFTEQGVAMLSSVLRSRRAIDVNIAIMRAFVHLRELLATHKDLARRIDELEKKYDGNFAAVFSAIRELMTPPSDPPKKRIGFGTADPAQTQTGRGRRS